MSITCRVCLINLAPKANKHFGFSGPQAAIFGVPTGHHANSTLPKWHSQTTHSQQSNPCSSSPDSRKTQPRVVKSTTYPVDSGPPPEGKGGSLVVPIFL